MSRLTKDDIFRLVEEEDVEFIRLQFIDIFGRCRNIAVTADHLEEALDREFSVEAAGISGFSSSGSGDLYLHPDLDTFEIFPWRPQHGKVARLFCNLYTEEGLPYKSDSRQILKRVLEEAAGKGLTFEADPELEFYLFHLDDFGRPTTLTHEQAGYLDVAPADLGENVRREIIQNLQEMGFQITSSHHEMAPAQHEIDFVGDRPDRAADQILTYKMAVKTVAKKHGLHATFMPKPLSGQYGSGMHIILKACDGEGRDAFADPSAQGGVSETGRCFLAGILEHIRGMSLVTNPLVNSYKRLVRGYDAPVDIAWSSVRSNRSALIHMGSRKGRVCLELRNPDCTCNPYLTLALCIAAGMDGIERGLDLPEETEINLFRLSSRQLKEMNMDRLPRTMGEAIVAYEEDEFIRKTMGQEAWSSYLKAKRREWKEYRSMVSQWELDQYLSIY